MASLPGGWSLHTSRSTGARYYSRPGSAPLWHDDALPAGWAWGRDSEAAPKFYVELGSGRRQDVVPHTPSSSSSSSSSSAAAAAAAVADKKKKLVYYCNKYTL